MYIPVDVSAFSHHMLHFCVSHTGICIDTHFPISLTCHGHVCEGMFTCTFVSLSLSNHRFPEYITDVCVHVYEF